MDLFSIIIIAIGLAMDCFAVSISQGICERKLNLRPALTMAFLFGLFQGVMPLIGFGIGQAFATQIRAVDHWLAFGILAVIGVKMIVESVKSKKDETCEDECLCVEKNRFSFRNLLILAIATSIDALATGLIFVSFQEWIIIATLIIGITSFIFSFAGVNLGHRFGKHFKFNFEIIGGIVLIIIGTKILLEHIG